AGSFTQDSSGNFVNANGFFLQGIPTTATNQTTFSTVSINQSATGAATATSNVNLGANFNAAQAVLLGNGVVGTMQATKGTSSPNVGISGSQIIVGNDVANTLTATNNLTRDVSTVDIVSGGVNVTDTFTYGGFAIGRDVTDNTVTGASP